MKTKLISLVGTLFFSATLFAEWHNGHEYVDLGLPSGTLWATCNIGATNPEDYGDYFAWGELEPKVDYTWENYKYGNAKDSLTKYCNDSSKGLNGFIDNLIELVPADDAAAILWGGAWKMPTRTDIRELLDYCQWSWTIRNNVQGYEIKGLNENILFLPAAGLFRDGKLRYDQEYGYYWSSSNHSAGPEFATNITFADEAMHTDGFLRYGGMQIRPTCKDVVPDNTALTTIMVNNHTIHKLLENGTLYILRNGEKYTIDGRKVK